MQRITIKHLGPIQELEMDMEKFNLVIGEQATELQVYVRNIM